ncbi:MAG: hypothetical protein M1814_003878 [Vezdaea aestivalis]|nr:MAG: hypothetical protein M1814_003878 [Vezdaea aestivalis]
MAASAASTIPKADLESFTKCLQSSSRVLALFGAGLSAASGLPTFRGAGGMWRNHEATSLATPEAFDANPGLVWQFYNYRRHMALQARPNRAHKALAELANRKPGFLALTQNVDGLSPRAGHPAGQLAQLHGSLFDIKCSSYCDYVEETYADPIVPALAIPRAAADLLRQPSATDSTGEEAASSLAAAMKVGQELDIADGSVPLPFLSAADLPQCPQCRNALLRPGVVWFGEALPSALLDKVDAWVREAPIDLMLVIGTSAQVYPAAGYVDEARKRGARVAVVNMDRADVPRGITGMTAQDWFFQGDAGVIIPEMLKTVIGEI